MRREGRAMDFAPNPRPKVSMLACLALCGCVSTTAPSVDFAGHFAPTPSGGFTRVATCPR